MQKGSVSIYFVRSALEPVLARGVDIDPLLQEAGISPAVLQARQGRVTAQNFSALWLGVARVLDDELFGQDSRRMKVGSFAMLSHILVDCDTLSAALSRITKFFNLILDDFHCAVEAEGRHALLTISETPGPAAPRVSSVFTVKSLYGRNVLLVRGA